MTDETLLARLWDVLARRTCDCGQADHTDECGFTDVCNEVLVETSDALEMPE